MNPATTFIAAVIIIPAAALAIWAWFAIAKVEEELRSFSGFDGMHFDIGHQAADSAEGTRCPIPG